MDDRTCIDPEVLLREASWVQSLARRLVHDAAEAEDIAQETLLVALRSVGAEQRFLRQWLSRVVRNLARGAHRRRSIRSSEELTAEHRDTIPSPLELVERASTQRSLVGTLLELEESDRTVLLLHHFEGLSGTEIARHWNVPRSTVAARLSRAHARLREKWLARNRGDRNAALAGLVACARGAPGIVSASSTAVRTAAGLGAAAALVGVIGVTAWKLRASPEPDAVKASVATAAVVPVDEASTRAGETSSGLRTSLRDERSTLAAPSPSSKEADTVPEGEGILIEGRAFDLAGEPVGALDVCRVVPIAGVYSMARGERTGDCATTDAEGRFQAVVMKRGWFAASAPGWTTVLACELGIPEQQAPVLVVARTQRVVGTVVDDAGHALAGVEVALAVAPDVLSPLGTLLDATNPIPRVGVTDANGAFAFDDAPRGELVVTAGKEGYQQASEALPDPGDAFLRPVQLVLSWSTVPTLTGAIVDPSGQPVEGARVSAGQAIVTTDASGEFLVTFDPAREPTATTIHLCAVHPDVGFAELELPLPSPEATWVPIQVRLVLADAPRSIEGRVVDRRGAPVPAIDVFVLEDTPFGRERIEGAPVGVGFRRSLESFLGARTTPTGADGGFRIAGLTARTYRLQALDETRLTSVISEPISAGTSGVQLVLDVDAAGPLAGRVVDHAGRPVAGVRVSVTSRQFWSGPEDATYTLARGSSAESDAEGRFEIADVAHEDVFLTLDGETIVPEILRELDPGADPTALELVVGRRCHLQIQWGDWSARADRMHLEAEDGTTLTFMDLRGFSMSPFDSLAVDTGLSAPIAIPDHAARAVLTHAGEEVTRVALHPVPGELEVVEP